MHWYNSKITLSGKEHSLPTTKEYVLKEYADIFRGIGTLPGMAYHIELKDSYKPVQHAWHIVPVGIQDAYNAELQRLLHEGVIVEVHSLHRVGQLYCASAENQWWNQIMSRSKRLE